MRPILIIRVINKITKEYGKCLRLGVFNADMAKLTERNLFFNVKK